jgi:hypothetical protein
VQRLPQEDYDLPDSVLIERQVARASEIPRERYLWNLNAIDRVEQKRLAREKRFPHEDRDDD